ncbi:MAG: TIGR00730 family Rossman fold protein [Rhodocyclaceae bacterium]|jgi:uncharacterized protein (TIGR00730 family)|nr:TIGR00730 family Rossman fold protein [Rhodocyclaceae bacterium]
MTIKRLCVFCGSRSGGGAAYAEAARNLGTLLAERRIELVYGGGKVGLMGVLANACLAAGGTVVGVIPRVLMDWEVGHEGLTRLEIVDSMHTRKARMADLADGFMALPGGMGTFEELFEILTWAQLGFHAKPVALLNVDGYYGPLIQMLERGVAEGFMKPENLGLLRHGDNLFNLLREMGQHHPPTVARRIKDERQL